MDQTSFPDASTQAVAGEPNREPQNVPAPRVEPLQLRCWPQGRTHEIRAGDVRNEDEDGEAIVVTGTLARNPNLVASSPINTVTAEQEDLGDLKLYRIPVPVTVAAHSQKQVALLRREGVRVRHLYRQEIDQGQADEEPAPAQWVLISRNRPAEGLGIPLPAGQLVVFGEGASRPVMLGVAAVRDHAVGEDVELQFGEATGVMTRLRRLSAGGGRARYELLVTNDRRSRIDFEAFLSFPQIESRERLGVRGDHSLWRTTVPANGTRVLRFTAPG